MNFDLYVITDEMIGGGRSHAEMAQRAVDGGADVIQLRDKTCSPLELLRTARDLRTITGKTGRFSSSTTVWTWQWPPVRTAFILARMTCGSARPGRLAPPGFIIGVSVGTTGEAVEAERDGADYLAISPTFSTASKDDAGPGRGLDRLREIRGAVSIPVIAIGGINRGNVRDVIAAGADGVAVISAVVASPDITVAARELKDLVKECKRSVKR